MIREKNHIMNLKSILKTLNGGSKHWLSVCLVM